MPGDRYERNIHTAERDGQAARLRAEGKTYDQIATTLGYSHRSRAREAVQRALVATVREAGDELRVLELERLDRLLDTAWTVLETAHPAHSAGRLVLLDGAPIPDAGPVLAAVDRILKIMERRSKLLGLDAPARSQTMTTDAIDAELARLEREHAELANPTEEESF